MSEFPPQFPQVATDVLESIIRYADETAEWLVNHAARVAEHGHDPNTHAVNIAGWRFVSEALGESL